MRIRLVVSCLLSLSGSWATAQNVPDVIRGHVRGADGTAIAGATVTATPVGGVTRTTRTDATGAYAIAFSEGDGPYTVVAAMLGYARQSVDAPRRVVGTP